MTDGFGSAIEAARVRLGVPADWTYTMCANECGDVVFLPPTVTGDEPNLRAVCSAKCGVQLFEKLFP